MHSEKMACCVPTSPVIFLDLSMVCKGKMAREMLDFLCLLKIFFFFNMQANLRIKNQLLTYTKESRDSLH